MQLKDSVIAITGGAQGLGLAIAEHIGSLGAKVAIIDINEKALSEAEQKLKKQGISTKTYVTDITQEKPVEELFAAIHKDFGTLNGLVNNAGIIRDGLLVKAKDNAVIKKMPLDDWHSVINTNLTGVFLCGREAASLMIENSIAGCIINISSITRAGNFGQSNYSAAKAGVVALTTTWAKELAQYQIRCGAIAPGFIKTEILEGMKQEALEKISSKIPAGRLGLVDEIAIAVEFILSNDYFSGRVLEVDGGLRI